MQYSDELLCSTLHASYGGTRSLLFISRSHCNLDSDMHACHYIFNISHSKPIEDNSKHNFLPGNRLTLFDFTESRTFVDALEVQPHLVVRNNLRMPLAVSLLPTSHPLVPALVHPQLNPEASRSVRVKASPELALDPLNLARTALPPSLLEAAVKLVSTLVLHLVAQALPRSTTLLLTAPGIPPPRQLPRALLLPDLISVVKPLLSRHNHLSLFSPSVHRRTQILHQVLASSVNQIL